MPNQVKIFRKLEVFHCNAMSHKNYTSETIRLEPSSSTSTPSRDNDRTLHLQAVIGANAQNYQKKKVSSFQITSIRPSSSHSSNDGGDDSENDTEASDILDSSKVTTDFDQETPSFSEDYSKSEEILLNSAPVIPPSTQVQFLVHQAGTGGMMTARLPQGVTVNVTEDGLALAKAEGESDGLDNWQKRFTIVKIDSNEPVKKGRWICLDFMDTPAVNTSETKGSEIPSLIVSNVVITEADTSKPPTHGVQIPITGSEAHYYLHSSSGQYFTPVSLSQTGIPTPQIQTTNSTQVTQEPSPLIQSGVQYSSSSQQVHNLGQVYTSHQSQSAPSVTQSLPVSSQPVVISEPDIQTTPRMSSNTNIPQSGIQVGVQHGIVTQSHPHPVVSQSEKSHQPAVINVVQQNPPQSNLGTSNPQGIIQPIVSNSNQPIISPTTLAQSQVHPQSASVSIAQASGVQSITSQSGTLPISSTPVSSSSTITSSLNYTSHPNTGVTPTPATTPAQPPVNLNVGGTQASVPADSQLQSLVKTSLSGSNVLSHPSTLDGLNLIGQNQESAGSNTATPPTGVAQTEETESASAASAVAIDNKIEQAMDLVKSHLMFAVREEVEVLKERIVELTDKIHNLESENKLLRQYAPQDTIQQVQQQLPPPTQHSSTSS